MLAQNTLVRLEDGRLARVVGIAVRPCGRRSEQDPRESIVEQVDAVTEPKDKQLNA